MNNPQKQVRNLFFLLGSACGLALLLVVGMIYYYGPSGQMRVGSVLLSADILEALHFEGDPSGGMRKERYLFDSLEWVVYEPEQRQWSRTPVSLEHYTRFYNLIRDEWSELDPERTMGERFNSNNVARLLLQIKPVQVHQPTSKYVFQEVQFSPDGDYYRVELRHGDREEKWAIYHHAGILKKAGKLLIERN